MSLTKLSLKYRPDDKRVVSILEDMKDKVNDIIDIANELHDYTTETWIAPSLLNSWVNYGSTYNPTGYYKDSDNVVHLRGLLKDGTIGDVNAFILKEGYRPAYQHVFMTISNNAVGRCDIYPSGNVFFRVGSNVYFSIDGINFRIK